MSSELGNEQEMISVDGLAGCHPAARLQGGGAEMGSDAAPGSFGSQGISRTVKQTGVRSPRGVWKTESGGDGVLANNKEESLEMVAEKVLKMV